MIIVKLMGGLGNQLFQYAAARSLALRHGAELKLDLSCLEAAQEGDTPRDYALHHFNINGVKASRWESSVMAGEWSNILVGFIARRLQKALRYCAYRENQFRVNPAFFSLSDNVYLDGYWQSERYFANYEDVIREELTLRTPLSGKNLEVAEAMRGVNAVSLHVRRGDYVTNEKTRAYHSVCDDAYYRKAEALLTQHLQSPHFFVFSDDSEWVVNNLKLRCPATFISHNGSAPHEDLRLMSLCRHHVLANSSFSWWGAWLSNRSDQLVVAPGKWFNDSSIDVSDLISPRWLRI